MQPLPHDKTKLNIHLHNFLGNNLTQVASLQESYHSLARQSVFFHREKLGFSQVKSNNTHFTTTTEWISDRSSEPATVKVTSLPQFPFLRSCSTFSVKTDRNLNILWRVVLFNMTWDHLQGTVYTVLRLQNIDYLTLNDFRAAIFHY